MLKEEMRRVQQGIDDHDANMTYASWLRSENIKGTINNLLWASLPSSTPLRDAEALSFAIWRAISDEYEKHFERLKEKGDSDEHIPGLD